MYSSTWASLWPCASKRRTWLRKSTASGACDAAMVSFWHTKQRSSLATRCTLSSSAASAKTGLGNSKAKPSAAHTTTALSHAPRMPGLATRGLQQRQQSGLHPLRCDRAGVFVTHPPLWVDDVGFGHAVDAKIQPH